ncbi:hypothetical protein QTP70_031189 [Hemibagrus guttatus]|uniref:BZIP domain-containing protein n=1 Tax=Hemibagrus guttatus TaxID=175788 RepID=A0AAE0PRI9_9TELE|nr:hypothetical protein QTP70_031189 [Hemibagrus guttatus]
MTFEAKCVYNISNVMKLNYFITLSLSLSDRVMMPTLTPFAGFPASTLSEQLKLAEIFSLQAAMTPGELTHTGKRPLSLLQSEMADEDERRMRRREKNKVAAARCRNKKKERTDFLQKESERLEVVNTELKSQIEELKQERQRLIHMLNLHRPTCIVRRDSVQTPESEKNPLLEQISPS